MSVASAHLHSLRHSARKVRVVLDLVRGKRVEEACQILAFTRRRPAETLLKLLRSAVANAGQKGDYKAESLYVSRIWADGGMIIQKNLEPKAMLRHGIQKKRSCHVTVELDVKLPVVARSGGSRSATEKIAGAPVAESGKEA